MMVAGTLWSFGRELTIKKSGEKVQEVLIYPVKFIYPIKADVARSAVIKVTFNQAGKQQVTTFTLA